jgi:hypothetical protein
MNDVGGVAGAEPGKKSVPVVKAGGGKKGPMEHRRGNEGPQRAISGREVNRRRKKQETPSP